MWGYIIGVEFFMTGHKPARAVADDVAVDSQAVACRRKHVQGSRGWAAGELELSGKDQPVDRDRWGLGHGQPNILGV